MPVAPPTPCRQGGCPALVSRRVNVSGYCAAHATSASNRAIDRYRGSSTARGYDSRWQRFREGYLRRHPLCSFCERRGLVTPATVIDHIETIADAPARRFDEDNLRPLCKPCHDAHTMRAQNERRRR